MWLPQVGWQGELDEKIMPCSDLPEDWYWVGMARHGSSLAACVGWSGLLCLEPFRLWEGGSGFHAFVLAGRCMIASVKAQCSTLRGILGLPGSPRLPDSEHLEHPLPTCPVLWKMHCIAKETIASALPKQPSHDDSAVKNWPKDAQKSLVGIQGPGKGIW